jgi:hypothetical protein
MIDQKNVRKSRQIIQSRGVFRKYLNAAVNVFGASRLDRRAFRRFERRVYDSDGAVLDQGHFAVLTGRGLYHLIFIQIAFALG